MPLCPVCGHDNTFGALVCARCFAFLSVPAPDEEAPDTPQWQQTTNNVPEHIHPARHVPHRFAPLAQDNIALFIEAQESPLIVEVKNQILLGRHTPGSTSQPQVDLAPFDAYSKGVSRLHAAIRQVEHCLFIEDLGSTNGSWLNSVRLIPFAARALRAGDLIQLSQLQITIYIA